jgi:hypothetical protein
VRAALFAFAAAFAAGCVASGGLAKRSAAEPGRVGDLSRPLDDYARALKESEDRATLLEYAYALALAGLHGPALVFLDRPAARGGADAACVAGEVFALRGDPALSGEVAFDRAACPAWLAPVAETNRRRYGRPLAAPPRLTPDALARAFREANRRAARGEHWQALDLFTAVLANLPGDYAAVFGRSIELERVGARQAAERMAEAAIAGAEGDEARGAARERLGDLRAGTTGAGGGLGGGTRLLGYFGGNASSTNAGVTGGFRGRAGAFVGSDLDVGVDLGLAFGAARPFTVGVSARDHAKISDTTYGILFAGLQASTGQDTSLGLTYGLGFAHLVPETHSSFDLILEGVWAPSGPSGVSVLFGVTRYFGR